MVLEVPTAVDTYNQEQLLFHFGLYHSTIWTEDAVPLCVVVFVDVVVVVAVAAVDVVVVVVGGGFDKSRVWDGLHWVTVMHSLGLEKK